MVFDDAFAKLHPVGAPLAAHIAAAAAKIKALQPVGEILRRPVKFELVRGDAHELLDVAVAVFDEKHLHLSRRFAHLFWVMPRGLFTGASELSSRVSMSIAVLPGSTVCDVDLLMSGMLDLINVKNWGFGLGCEARYSALHGC